MRLSVGILLVLTMSRFLLVVLHLESLASQLNPTDVRNALEKLPTTLDDTYHEALQRIADQGPPSLDMANKVLYWISHAYRPLTTEELQCALAVSPGLTAFDKDAVTPRDTLVSVCGGLVTYDPQSRIIRLVHYTTQEFIEKIRNRRFPTAQADITRTCLTYLSFDHPKSYVDRYMTILPNIESIPFLRYAAQHWRDHMRASPETNFNELILQNLEQPVKVQCILQAMDDKLRDFRQYRNVSPLCAAAILGLKSIVLLLLESGADLTDSVTNDRQTALFSAVEFAQLEVIKVLVDHGASVNRLGNKLIPPLTQTIYTAWMTNCEAAVATARLLLDRGADIDFQGGLHTQQASALMEAAQSGCVPLVELLLTRGADVDLRLDDGSTALLMACGENPRIFRLLVDYGADLEDRDSYGNSSLLKVSGDDSLSEEPEDTVRMLVNLGADIHSRNDLGETALFKAATNGYHRIIQVLTEYGADIHARSKRGRSVLFTAIERYRPSYDIVSLLLELGVDVNLQDSAGDTALTRAAAQRKLDGVKLLLGHGANAHTKNEAGDTALTLAAAAEPTLEECSCYDKGRNRIDDATLIPAVVEQNFIILELLLKHGASVAVQNRAGDTALTLAAAKGKLDVVKLLLNHAADPHMNNDAGDTAFTLAAAAEATLVRSRFGNEEGRIDNETQLAAFAERNLVTLELLLKHGVSVAVKNEAGDTALTLAAAKGKLDVVKLLLNHEADPHTKNEAGDTALSLSAEYGHSEVHQLLLDHLSEANQAPTSTEDE